MAAVGYYGSTNNPDVATSRPILPINCLERCRTRYSDRFTRSNPAPLRFPTFRRRPRRIGFDWLAQEAEGWVKMQFRSRHANIDEKRRAEFERVSVQVVSLALGLGSLTPGSNQFPTDILQMIVVGGQNDAAEWLREKREEEECHATRIEIVEWSILIFVVLSVILEIVTLIRPAHKSVVSKRTIAASQHCVRYSTGADKR